MSEKKKMNPFNGIVNYFREVRAELKKVVWPTLKQIKNNTVIVIICLLFVGAIIWVLDLGFGATLGTVVDKANSQQNQMIDIDESAVPGNELTQEQLEEMMQQAQEEQGDAENGEAAPEKNNE